MTKIRENINPDYLKANCSRAEEEEVRYDFTPYELTEMKADLVDASIEQSVKDMLGKKITATLAADSDDLANQLHLLVEKANRYLGPRGIKTLKARAGELLEKVKNGYEMRTIMVYEMDYSEEGRLEYYNGDGVFLWEKPVAGARQLQIKSKAAVNQ